MFSSLRSRFSLTFALLIVIVLCMATLMMFLVVRNIPIRTTNIRLQELTRILYAREEIAALLMPRRTDVLQRLSERYDVRILIAGGDGAVVFDSGAANLPAVANIPLTPLFNRSTDSVPGGTFRDAERRLWQYVLRPMDDRFTLVLAAPQPRLQSLNILRDDLLPPLLWVAGFTLLFAILLARLTARWVSGPLEKIASATRKVPGGTPFRIEESGPDEVKQLARAFNEMNAQVASGKRSQQDFVANVSHELKTPLTAIQGFAQALLDGTASTDPEIARAAGVIFSEAGRMDNLVHELLELARIEGGSLAFDPDPVDINSLLENLVLKFTPLIRSSQVELVTDLQPLPGLTGNGDRLMQVFNNLLDNAVKHSPVGGKVEIRSEHSDGFARVHFIDTGPGIPPEEQDRIFERFYQLDKARDRSRQPGFGLGLAIAQEIVHAHGGQISIISTAGRGSDFVVKLPFTRKVNADLTTDS